VVFADQEVFPVLPQPSQRATGLVPRGPPALEFLLVGADQGESDVDVDEVVDNAASCCGCHLFLKVSLGLAVPIVKGEEADCDEEEGAGAGPDNGMVAPEPCEKAEWPVGQFSSTNRPKLVTPAA